MEAKGKRGGWGVGGDKMWGSGRGVEARGRIPVSACCFVGGGEVMKGREHLDVADKCRYLLYVCTVYA